MDDSSVFASPDPPDHSRRVLIKGRCEDCAYYQACPRMKGENICYGKKEVLAPDGSQPSIEESTHSILEA